MRNKLCNIFLNRKTFTLLYSLRYALSLLAAAILWEINSFSSDMFACMTFKCTAATYYPAQLSLSRPSLFACLEIMIIIMRKAIKALHFAVNSVLLWQEEEQWPLGN